MQSQTLNTLRIIGEQLDQNQFPCVYNDGIVMPSEAAVNSLTMGKEKDNGSERKRRPTAEPWKWTARRQRQTSRPRASCGTTPVICTDIQNQYEAELGAVREAYPSTECWKQDEGLWLRTESTLIHGLDKKATFLSAFPYNKTLPTKSWAFWSTPFSHQWIGPRHTNFPDGSICAFESKDRTWTSGDSIITLLDLYSVWAVRHQHLEVFGKWAGHQSVSHPYERLIELNDDEHCGCEHSDRYYGECCKPKDLARDITADAINFFLNYVKDGLRMPPKEILAFMWNRNEPPPIMNFFR